MHSSNNYLRCSCYRNIHIIRYIQISDALVSMSSTHMRHRIRFTIHHGWDGRSCFLLGHSEHIAIVFSIYNLVYLTHGLPTALPYRRIPCGAEMNHWNIDCTASQPCSAGQPTSSLLPALRAAVFSEDVKRSRRQRSQLPPRWLVWCCN